MTMNWKFGRAALLAAIVSIAQMLVSQTTPDRQVGSLPDGGFLLNNGWILRPAGTQVPVDTLPLATAATKNGKYLLILNCGFNTPSVSVVDIAQKREIGRTPLPDAWLGLTISSAQDRVYVGGAGKAVVYELSLNPQTGALARAREFAIVPDLATKGASFTGDVMLSADNRILYAADLHGDSIAMIDVASGGLLKRWKSGPRPYRLLLDGKSLLVSSWAAGAVYRYDAHSGAELSVTPVGPHATDMALLKSPLNKQRRDSDDDGERESAGPNYSARLFVAAANTNHVYAFALTKSGPLHAIETINISLP